MTSYEDNTCSQTLLFIFCPKQVLLGPIYPLLHTLIHLPAQHLLLRGTHSEHDGLAGGYAHHTRCDALVECGHALVPEHFCRNLDQSRNGCFPGLLGSFLYPCFDRVDRRVREGAHGARDETEHHGLIRGQVGVLRLVVQSELLELLVRGKVNT
jgi:hypothetical protein